MPLAVDHLGFRYPGGPDVLSGISAAFPQGALSTIIGPNGAGKSTLLRLMLGVLTPTEGRATLDGTPVHRHPPRRRAARIAYIPQRSTLASPFTVRQVVRLGRFARPAGEGAVDEAIRTLGLADRAADPFGILSIGQQQRASLARALAQLDGEDVRPAEQVILADEPMSAMDPRHALEAMSLLRDQARAGRAVVVVIHDLTTALRFADHALLLDSAGRAAAAGPARDVLRPEVLSPVFDVPFRLVGGGSGGAALIPELPASLP